MPLHFQCRFTDDQVAAIDVAACITDARTGMSTQLTRQQVVLAIVEAWRVEQAMRPHQTPPAEAVPVAVPPVVEPLESTSAGKIAPVISPSRAPTKKKAKAKAKGKPRPSSATLDMEVLLKVVELGTCSCAAVQKALAMANSTIYGVLQRLVAAGKLTKDGETYAVVPGLQAGA